MIAILIVTHGALGDELLKAARNIVGAQEGVRVLRLDPSDGPKGLEEKTLGALKELENPAGVLILVDMFGGTPCNVGLRQCRDSRFHFDMVTGVNLPMLISALSNRHYMPLAQLARKLVEDAPRHILRPIQKLQEGPR